MKFEIEWEGKTYECNWVEETDFEKLDKITSILGFIFNEEGQLCLVNFPKKENWCLPGGHLEDYDKSHLDCLIREVDEEADLVLKDITPLGYIESKVKGEKEIADRQLRFVAKVDKMNPQTIDPAEGIIPERKFIDPKEFVEHTGWIGGNGLLQLNKALEILNKK